jgi:hypothetical protein
MRRVQVPNARGSKKQFIALDALGGAALGENIYYNGVLLDPKLVLNSFAVGGVQPNTGLGDLTTDSIYEGSRKFFTIERAQDAIAQAFVDSANVRIVYDDAANTFTPDLTETGIVPGEYAGITFDAYGRATAAEASGGGGGAGEILVADGISAPPIMLTNEAEDDFVYGD